MKNMTNLNLDQLPNIKIPSLQTGIDYCTLHETTGDENYRKLAVDGFRGYCTMAEAYNLILPKLVEELYPILNQKLALVDLTTMGIDQAKITEFVDRLKQPMNLEQMNEWRDHCLGCKKVDFYCADEREKLIGFNEKNKERGEGLVEDIVKVIEDIAKEIPPMRT